MLVYFVLQYRVREVSSPGTGTACANAARSLICRRWGRHGLSKQKRQSAAAEMLLFVFARGVKSNAENRQFETFYIIAEP